MRLRAAELTLLRNRAVDVFGRELPCTFRPSSFGFASLCRSAIVSMIGGSAGSAAGINAESSSSLWSTSFVGLPETVTASPRPAKPDSLPASSL